MQLVVLDRAGDLNLLRGRHAEKGKRGLDIRTQFFKFPA